MAYPWQVSHGWMYGKNFRFVGTPSLDRELNVGDVVKVVMVSGTGDVGITKKLAATNGYSHRVETYELEKIESQSYPMDSRVSFENDCPKGDDIFRCVFESEIVPWID